MAPKPILYHYSYSPYAHKITYYLILRGIPYLQCPQPPIMPRPDLSQQLGVTYRRIPVLALGNCVYINTPLILAELEKAFPQGALGGGREAEDWGRQSDTVFRSAVACIPTSLPVMKDARFRRYRQELTGQSVEPEAVEKNRPRALAGLEKGFQRTEEALKDGRDWILSGGQPTLADINAVWVLEWVITLPGALDGSGITREKYPRTFAWVDRFMAKMGKAKRGDTISGADAKEAILGADADAAQGQGQGGGEVVKVTPTDTGRGHPQVGRLVSRENGRVVLEVKPPGEERRTLKVVFPEEGFEVTKADDVVAKL